MSSTAIIFVALVLFPMFSLGIPLAFYRLKRLRRDKRNTTPLRTTTGRMSARDAPTSVLPRTIPRGRTEHRAVIDELNYMDAARSERDSRRTREDDADLAQWLREKRERDEERSARELREKYQREEERQSPALVLDPVQSIAEPSTSAAASVPDHSTSHSHDTSYDSHSSTSYDHGGGSDSGSSSSGGDW